VRLSEAYRTLNGLTLRLGQEWDSCEQLVSAPEVINIYSIAGGTQVAKQYYDPSKRAKAYAKSQHYTPSQEGPASQDPNRSTYDSPFRQESLHNESNHKSCNSVMPPLSTITANRSTMWL
jgi:hypothetical protein